MNRVSPCLLFGAIAAMGLLVLLVMVMMNAARTSRPQIAAQSGSPDPETLPDEPGLPAPDPAERPRRIRPPSDLFFFEATDPDAPPKYRDYFARRLRNLGKTSGVRERNQLAARMREAMTGSPAGAPHLAHVLIAFDDSTASLRAVEARLQAPGDDATTAAFLAPLP